jgi:hypothetical protein
MLGRILFIVTVIAAVLLGVIFQTTTPATIGPLGILFVFILMYTVALGVLTFLIFSVSIFLQKSIGLFIVAKKPLRPLGLSRSYYFASLVALAPVMLVGIHSVGELGFYDVLLVGVFVVISCVYVAKRTQ